MENLFQLAASVGGIGGLVAIVVLFFYRYLVSQMREDRKFMEDRLTKLLDSYNNSMTENTKILMELYTYLTIKNGKKE